MVLGGGGQFLMSEVPLQVARLAGDLPLPDLDRHEIVLSALDLREVFLSLSRYYSQA